MASSTNDRETSRPSRPGISKQSGLSTDDETSGETNTTPGGLSSTAAKLLRKGRLLVGGRPDDPVQQASDNTSAGTSDSLLGTSLSGRADLGSPLQPRSVPANIGEGRRASSPMAGAFSPTRTFQSPSPHHLSPATSQIFERDVQEATMVPDELAPVIPAHIHTEDHIPPVLEASSLAITDDHLNPDEVEIVTHTAHQPAAVVVTNQGLADSGTLGTPSQADFGFVASQEHDDIGPTYGQVDPSDPRRLSFISFADVVHASQVEAGSSVGSVFGNRSPSPARSPLGTDRLPLSPPLSGSASFKGGETSPVRGGPGSTVSGLAPPAAHGEISIETMRQTLQTASNDIAGLVQPQPHSPGMEGGTGKRP